MAKKDPAELKKEGEDLKVLFAKIKKKPHNCAILMCKGGVVIQAHITKSTDAMVKLAKKSGGTMKGAWGTITMEGQVLVITPENDRVPGSLDKIAKKYFNERGIKNRLEVKPAASEDKDGKDAKSDKDADKKKGAKEKQALTKQFKKITPDIKIALQDDDAAKDLRKMITGYRKLIKQDETENAGKVMVKMDELVKETLKKLKAEGNRVR